MNSPRAKVAMVVLPVLLVVASSLLMSSCSGSPSSGSKTSTGASSDSSLDRVVLEVPTIWCSTCKLRVEASVKSVPGVKVVQFDTQRTQRVIVTYDPTLTTPEAIVEAIEKGGDKVTQVTKL